MSHFWIHLAYFPAHSWRFPFQSGNSGLHLSTIFQGCRSTVETFLRMDHRELPPRLPPRSGIGGSGPRLPPRPAPPLPPRLPLRAASTNPDREESCNTDRYRQPTVADDLQSEAVENITNGFGRLWTTPVAIVQPTQPQVPHSSNSDDFPSQPYTQQQVPSGSSGYRYPNDSPSNNIPPYFPANTSRDEKASGIQQAKTYPRSAYSDPAPPHSTIQFSSMSTGNTVPISDLITSRPYTSRSFLRECPERDPVQFPALWYYLEQAKAFTVCSHCYNTIIHGFESGCGISFGSFTGTKHQTLFCMFGRPHPKSLYKKGDFLALRTFMASRTGLKVTTCHGLGGANANLSTTWYKPRNGEIDGMVSCEACYEDYIAHTSFSSRFEKSAPQPAGQVWACDIAVPLIRRTLEACLEGARNDWRVFVAATTHRLKVPACEPYKERAAQSTRWFQPKDSLPGFIICEACYLDRIASTCIQGHFTSTPLSSGQIQHQKSLTCMLSYFPMAIAVQEAIFSENFQLWCEAAKIFMHEELCDGTARKGKSYTLIVKDGTGDADFNICQSCYTCCIDLFGFGSHFKQVDMKTHTEAGIAYSDWACDFYPTRYGFSKYMDALNEAVCVKEFSVLRDFIARYQGVTQPCPRSTFVKGRRWYGTSDFSACPDCFEETIQGTALESMIVVRNQLKETECSCDIYSPRMREIWKNACDTNDYAGFVELVRHRASVYWQTVPVMKRLLSQQRIRLMQQQTLNGSSMLYQRLDMSASASSSINYSGYSQPRYTYGAADVGYGYASTYGIEAARLGQQANNLVQSSRSDTTQVAYLEALWEAVE